MFSAYKLFTNLNEESRVLLNHIQKRGPIDKIELKSLTEYNLTRINRIVTALEQANIIIRVGEGDSTGGRRPILYDVNTSDFFVIALAFGTRHQSFSIVNLKVEPIIHCSYREDLSICKPQQLFDRISNEITDQMKSLGITSSKIIGMGVSALASIDIQSCKPWEKELPFCHKEWHQTSIAELIRKYFPYPFVLDNGVNCEALWYYLYNDYQKQPRSFLHVNCASSIRSALLTDGKVIRGIDNRDTVFGHMTIDAFGRSCYCGNYGCIEAYATINSIVTDFVAQVKSGRNNATQKTVDRILYSDIIKAAQQGDQLAQESIMRAGSMLGLGLANYITLVNPDVVLLAGRLIEESELYFESAYNAAISHIRSYSKQPAVKILPSTIRQDKIVLAGAAIFIEYLLSNVNLPQNFICDQML